MTELKARAIAFYLPQFHPVPENNEWWGKGFTEWTNVVKARPLFKGHYQPHLPADLGFYDLRLPEVREAQARLAKEHGIEGFCYWHYWFGNGKRILERPFNEVLLSNKPNFPFCLGWANESWTGIWHGNPGKVLVEQQYPGKQDYIEHFNYLIAAFKDSRYITVEGKPLFYIYSPDKIPDLLSFTTLYQELAIKAGLKGLYIVANTSDEEWDPGIYGCDAINLNRLGSLYQYLPSHKNYLLRKYRNQLLKPKIGNLYKKLSGKPVNVYDYKDAIPFLVNHQKKPYDVFPCVIPNWDNTARSGLNGLVLNNSTPRLFEQHLKDALKSVQDKPYDKRIIFIKSWNEWAEGNHLEPDAKFGMQHLKAVKKVLSENS
jgi:hypothetical protein